MFIHLDMMMGSFFFAFLYIAQQCNWGAADWYRFTFSAVMENMSRVSRLSFLNREICS